MTATTTMNSEPSSSTRPQQVTVPDSEALDRLLRRGTAEVIREADLVRLLQTTERPLRIKFGVDPSSADLHLGHTVCFRKLRQFQALGHTIVLIVGDWTAQIGDPTGRSATRRMLTAEQVRANARTYTDQLFRVLDPEGVEVRWQSEWFGSYTLEHVMRLTAKTTVAKLLAREDFRSRFEAGQPLALVELLYPLLQAQDSVEVRADVELGGSDQTFNLLLGRDLQNAEGQTPQQVVMVPLLVGTDGVQKMSKSLGNAIAIVDSSDEMFGKVMSLPDEAMLDFFELVTDLPTDDLDQIRRDLANGSVNPRDVKRRLGREIVSQFHGAGPAVDADQTFMRRFSRREMPDEIPVVRLSIESFGQPVGVVDVLIAVGLAASRTDARRLILGGGVSIGGEKQSDPAQIVTLEPRTVVQVSRRRFVRVILE
jgi:tyrosyl-tRNA synthetase